MQFTSKSITERIFQAHFATALTIEAHQIKILKEIPGRILRKRKDYKFLTDALNANGIHFRWELPEGVYFFYKGKKNRFTELVSTSLDRKSDISDRNLQGKLPKVFFDLVEHMDLYDLWRIKNSNAKEYTYFSERYQSHSRIDMVWTSKAITPCMEEFWWKYKKDLSPEYSASSTHN